MLSFGRHLPFGVLGAVCAMGVVTAPPAFGEEGGGQFTVLGRHDARDEHSLTAAVSYRDLDLTTRDGRAALRARVWKTAEKLCARIGESHVSSATRALSCEDQAVYGASGQLQTAIAQARFAAAPERQPTVASAGSRSDGARAGGNPGLTVSVAAIR
jgi:UrcA family protein